MGKKGGGDGGAAQARADEEARQARIRQGTNSINDIFDGTTKGVNPTTQFQDGSTYYTADGSPVTYGSGQTREVIPFGEVYKPKYNQDDMVGFLASQRDYEKNPQYRTLDSKGYYDSAGNFTSFPAGQLFTGSETTGGFNDDFYNAREKAYLDYANPQLEDQYSKAQKELAFALDRAGTLNSSIRAQKEAELTQAYDTNKRSVADQALSYKTTAKNNVENARSDLIAMLNSTGDAQGATNSAMARASTLSAPDTYSPLADLFSTFTNTLGSQYASEKAAALASQYGTTPTGTTRFNTGSNSVVNSR